MRKKSAGMEYRSLGKTSLRVSAVGLGAVTFGREIDEPASRNVLDCALEYGITLVDTAAVYGAGASETILGRWLKDRAVRPRLVVATKVSLDGSAAGQRLPFGEEHIRASLEGSLMRLGIDCVDLYQLHSFCFSTPLEVTLEALGKMVKEGKAQAIGCSNFAAWQLCKALWISDRSNLPRFEATQPPYNLLERQIEGEVVPLCLDQHVSVISYGPLIGGFLTGKYNRGGAIRKGSRFDVIPEYAKLYLTEHNFGVAKRLAKVAEEQGVTTPGLALSWVMGNPGISSVLIGARERTHVSQAVQAYENRLSVEERRALLRRVMAE